MPSRKHTSPRESFAHLVRRKQQERNAARDLIAMADENGVLPGDLTPEDIQRIMMAATAASRNKHSRVNKCST